MVGKGNYTSSFAVVFHSPTLYNEKPLPKQDGQIWVFYTLEPPYLHPDRLKLKRWNRLFNWTIGYRRDADILNAYGRVKTLPQQQQQANVSIRWKEKKDMAVWFVSNCKDNSRRGDYGRLLRKRIFIDIYGNCGTLKCKKSENGDCQRMIKERYKFYLSFESEFCRDYITEKTFKVYFDNLDAIPIVRGADNYNMYLPPKSYINTADFKSTKDLGKHMLALAHDDRKALPYFRWRRQYYMESMDQDPFCELCEKLHDPRKYNRVYENIDDWVRGEKGQEICERVEDLN